MGHEAWAALRLLTPEHRTQLGSHSGRKAPCGCLERGQEEEQGPCRPPGEGFQVRGLRHTGGTRNTAGLSVGNCHQRGHHAAVPWGSGSQLKGWGTHTLQ